MRSSNVSLLTIYIVVIPMNYMNETWSGTTETVTDLKWWVFLRIPYLIFYSSSSLINLIFRDNSPLSDIIYASRKLRFHSNLFFSYAFSLFASAQSTAAPNLW